MVFLRESCQGLVAEVFINGELVYERTEEMIKREKQEFDLYASSLVESKKKELK